MSTYTRVGLQISGTQMQPTDATFGYKRFEGAIVPVKSPKKKKGLNQKSPPKMASVSAISHVENSWSNGLVIRQFFATGQSAKNLMHDPNAAVTLLQKMNLKDQKPQKDSVQPLKPVSSSAKQPKTPADKDKKEEDDDKKKKIVDKVKKQGEKYLPGLFGKES